MLLAQIILHHKLILRQKIYIKREFSAILIEL